MLEILQPFEVRDGDTTGVEENIWEDEDSVLFEDDFGLSGGWAVGSFSEDLALEFVSVGDVQALFLCGRDKDVAWLVECGIIAP